MHANFVPPTVKTAEELLLDFERSSDPSSFEEIVRRYSGMVYRVCFRVTRNPHDAEDATQAVFLKLAVQARTTNGVPRVGAWLQQVARTTSTDLRRSRNRRSVREQAALAERPSASADATESLGMDELKQLLRDEVDLLPPGYRTPLILYYFGGLSTEQVAKELKSNAKALGVRLFRGRKMLAGRLKDRGVSIPGDGGMMKVALAGAVISALADSFRDRVPRAGAVAAARALRLTPTSALTAAIVARVMDVVRACSALPRATRLTLSVLLLLTMSSAMAGSSPSLRSSPTVKQVGGWFGRLTDVFSGFKFFKRWSLSESNTPPAGGSATPVPAPPADAGQPFTLPRTMPAAGARAALALDRCVPRLLRSASAGTPDVGVAAIPSGAARALRTASSEISATRSLLAMGQPWQAARPFGAGAPGTGGSGLPASERRSLIAAALKLGSSPGAAARGMSNQDGDPTRAGPASPVVPGVEGIATPGAGDEFAGRTPGFPTSAAGTSPGMGAPPEIGPVTSSVPLFGERPPPLTNMGAAINPDAGGVISNGSQLPIPEPAVSGLLAGALVLLSRRRPRRARST
jgi:RNA polymerase sigma factor (sigma-70 family)